ncbi:MAG: hypothetical protein PHR36_01790 [Patescibacteria group bacterium]|nr:hypothetical protein [Patescibacteria group bacterium]
MLRTNTDVLNRVSAILIISGKTNATTLGVIKRDMQGVNTPYEVSGQSLAEKTREKIRRGEYDLILQRGKNGEISVHPDFQHLMHKQLVEELAQVA